jgi:hypothetical protein
VQLAIHVGVFKTGVVDPHLSYHKVLSLVGQLVLSLYFVSLGITLPLPSDKTDRGKF